MHQDLADSFGRAYALAWSSQDPERVTDHFADHAVLVINNEHPAQGHEAIAAVARAYMTDFPDLLVTCDRMIRVGHNWHWHWTMTGHNTGPNGTGCRIDISGYEALEFDEENRIVRAEGHFDQEAFDRQMDSGEPQTRADGHPSVQIT